MRNRLLISAAALAALAAFAGFGASERAGARDTLVFPHALELRSGVIPLGPGQRLRFVAVNVGDAPARVSIKVSNSSLPGGSAEPCTANCPTAATGVVTLEPGRGLFLDSHEAGFGARVVAREQKAAGKGQSVRYTLAVIDQTGRTVGFGGQDFEVFELNGQDFE